MDISIRILKQILNIRVMNRNGDVRDTNNNENRSHSQRSIAYYPLIPTSTVPENECVRNVVWTINLNKGIHLIDINEFTIEQSRSNCP